MSTKSELYNNLAKLVKEMDLPNERANAPIWLNKHMHKRNKDHKYYQEALDLVTTILKKGWN
jgi:hypothetical protein